MECLCKELVKIHFICYKETFYKKMLGGKVAQKVFLEKARAQPSPRKKARYESPKKTPEKVVKAGKEKPRRKSDSPKADKVLKESKKEAIVEERKKVDSPKKRTFTQISKTSVECVKRRNSIPKSPPKKIIASSTSKHVTAARPVETSNDVPSQLWVDKYKPSNLKGIIGQQGDKSNMKKLVKWLTNWEKHHSGGKKPPSRPPPFAALNDDGAWAKAALLSGNVSWIYHLKVPRATPYMALSSLQARLELVKLQPRTLLRKILAMT